MRNIVAGLWLAAGFGLAGVAGCIASNNAVYQPPAYQPPPSARPAPQQYRPPPVLYPAPHDAHVQRFNGYIDDLIRSVQLPPDKVAAFNREQAAKAKAAASARARAKVKPKPPPIPPPSIPAAQPQPRPWLVPYAAKQPPIASLAKPSDAGPPPLDAPPVAQAAGEPNPLLVPAGARPYQRTMLRESRAVWGMSAPTSLFGAQIQTESGWHPTAHSPYAAGLAQFIPSTAHAMAAKYPDTLGADDPLNPQWAIRALVQYDRDLWAAVRNAREGCDRWAFALSAYNGGPGWIPRDRALCTQHDGCATDRWFGNVERYTGRSVSNAKQNREYPRRILLQYQPAYSSWGGLVKCP